MVGWNEDRVYSLWARIMSRRSKCNIIVTNQDERFPLKNVNWQQNQPEGKNQRAAPGSGSLILHYFLRAACHNSRGGLEAGLPPQKEERCLMVSDGTVNKAHIPIVPLSPVCRHRCLSSHQMTFFTPASDIPPTERTVKTHVHNIFGKLGVTSRTQAVARAHDLDLV